MNNNTEPHIQPIKEINYEFTRSKYAVASKVPFRSIIIGPSGSSKSVLLTNINMDIYKEVLRGYSGWSKELQAVLRPEAVSTKLLPIMKFPCPHPKLTSSQPLLRSSA